MCANNKIPSSNSFSFYFSIYILFFLIIIIIIILLFYVILCYCSTPPRKHISSSFIIIPFFFHSLFIIIVVDHYYYYYYYILLFWISFVETLFVGGERWYACTIIIVNRWTMDNAARGTSITMGLCAGTRESGWLFLPAGRADCRGRQRRGK